MARFQESGAISRLWSKATSGSSTQHGVILVSPDTHPHVKKELGQAFIDWLVSPEGQAAIASFRINGEQLFFPNAGQSGA
jgi:tungstate transport system substrate-binding protein